MKARTAAAVLALTLLSGCASTNPYKDSLVRFGQTGKAVQPMLRTPADPSEEALQAAFGIAVEECLKVGASR